MIDKTEEQWKKELTPEQYHILREKGTEAPFTGTYHETTERGIYTCGACGAEVFVSDNKYDAGCGWPSFDRPVADDSITEKADTSLGMQRTEVVCSNCGSHLGHVFDDGPVETTGQRFCINSGALKFTKDDVSG